MGETRKKPTQMIDTEKDQEVNFIEVSRTCIYIMYHETWSDDSLYCTSKSTCTVNLQPGPKLCTGRILNMYLALPDWDVQWFNLVRWTEYGNEAPDMHHARHRAVAAVSWCKSCYICRIRMGLSLETLYGGCTDPLTKSVYFMQVIKFLRTAD